MRKPLTEDKIKDCIIGDISPSYQPPSWDIWFMQQVYLVASKSKDNSTKIGAVITKGNRVISTGYNGLPTGVDDSVAERYLRPTKYMWFEHGERNAIYAAAKFGGQTEGATLYTQGIPCADCGRAVIQAGIKLVVVHGPFEDVLHTLRNHWNESCATSEVMFKEAGVRVRWVDELIGVEGYANGKVIHV
jgi:dCMP deaminase